MQALDTRRRAFEGIPRATGGGPRKQGVLREGRGLQEYCRLRHPVSRIQKESIQVYEKFDSFYAALSVGGARKCYCRSAGVRSTCCLFRLQSGPRELLAPGSDFRKETKEPDFAEYGILMPTFDDRFYSAGEPLTATELIWSDVLSRVLLDGELRRQYTNRSKERVKDFTVDKLEPFWERILDEVLES